MISSNDGEWIVCTPDGYFNNSPEGTHLIHWVFPGAMETFSIEQFESYFKSPEIVVDRLFGNLCSGKPIPEVTQPPSVEMHDHMSFKEVSSRTYRLKLTAKAVNKVKAIRIFVNGKPINEIQIDAKEKEVSIDVPLF